LSSLDGHMMSWLDTSPKATKSGQVSVVPKSVGLVSPNANPSPNPWGQKLHQKSNHVPYYLFNVIICLGNMYYGVTDTFLT
jgi:hypothetical protein